MASSNPQGQMAFWDNGFPFDGVQLGTNDAGTMQFWDNGFPNVYQFPSGGPPPSTSIKTFNGLAYASTKTKNGLAVASIKTANGLA